MKRIPSRLRFPAVIMMLGGLALPAAAADLTLGELKSSFEKAFRQSEVDHMGRLATLDTGYIAALERLKGTLGREEKLEQAALVLTEIDKLKANEAFAAIPPTADRRFRELRKKREGKIAEYNRGHDARLKELSGKYVASLSRNMRALTRDGQIREALDYDNEIKRVNQLIESKRRSLAVARKLSGKIFEGDVALATRGAKARGATDARTMIDGDATMKTGHYAHSRWPCTFTIELGDLYQLDRLLLHFYTLDNRVYKYRVSVSDNKRDWSVVADRSEKGASKLQEVKFSPRDVQFIKIEGLHNSLNEYFHLFEVEAFCPVGK